MAATTPNYIRHLNAFIAISQNDKRLTGNHVSLYLALFHIWNQNFFRGPFPINRAKVLKISHIGSCHTYNKCMKDLENFRYIKYFRSQTRSLPSTIGMETLLPIVIRKNAPPTDANMPYAEGTYAPIMDANMLPIINSINNVNNERGKAPPPQADNPKDLNEVRDFFKHMNQPESEADKFFHHYEANSWCQGGGLRITNWQAAAQKWILNIHPTEKLKNDKRKQGGGKTGNLNSNEDKSYSDPF